MFLDLVCRKKLILRISNDLRTTQFLQNPSLFITSRSIRSKHVSIPHKLTVEYLTNSCGLSPESALKASKQISLKSTTRPDSVLSLLNSYGFTKPQILRIIRYWPPLLLASPEKSLRPKLEYFSNMGIAGPNLAKIISTNPNILKQSLQNAIIPSVCYLRSLFGTDEGVNAILNRSWWVLNDAKRIMGSNIALLRDHGVPQCNIAKFLILCPQSLYKGADKIDKTVFKLASLGFCPSRMTFMYGLHVLVGLTSVKWDEKMAVYRSFGWSEYEVLDVFRKQPSFMRFSVKKISSVLDFFMNSLKWTRDDIARNASIISLSLEKRVIPRCHVLQILLSKNLISKTSMGKALRVKEYVFLEKYVSKFHNEVPDLLNVYQSRMSTRGLRVGAENGRKLLDKI